VARKNQPRIGQIWVDTKGSRYEIQGWDGKKFHTTNLDTGRANMKGPRALVELASGSPEGGRRAHLDGPPSPKKPKKKTKKSKRASAARRKNMSPAQIAVFGTKAQKKALGIAVNPTPARRRRPPAGVRRSYTEPTMPVSSIRNAGPLRGMQNPSNYPSPLTKFVAESLSQMSPAYAGIPSMVMEAVGRAVAQWQGQQRQAAAAANPYSGHDYGYGG
jgi:hypothetical protein